jgi:hypothetical protein
MPSAADDFVADDDFVPDAQSAAAPESHFVPRSFGEAAQQAKAVFGGIGRGLLSANDFATHALTHPIDTARQIAGAPGASFRTAMRGVNSNIPFANRAVETAGGPPAESAADAAAAPAGLADFSGVAAAPGIGKMVGGIAAKGIEAGGEALGRTAKAMGERAVKEAAKAPGTSTFAKGAKGAGATSGAYLGYKAGGGVGAGGGAYAGKLIGEQVGKVGDKVTAAVARRYLAAIQKAIPAAEEIEPIPVPDNPQLVPLAEPPAPRLAPLVPEGPRLPTSVPNGALGTPFLDEISGQPVTKAGEGGFLPTDAETVPGAKAVSEAVPKAARAPKKSELEKLLEKSIEQAKLRKAGPASFQNDVINTAKLVKMAAGGAKRAAVKAAGQEMGLSEDIVKRVLDKAVKGHEADPLEE